MPVTSVEKAAEGFINTKIKDPTGLGKPVRLDLIYFIARTKPITITFHRAGHLTEASIFQGLCWLENMMIYAPENIDSVSGNLLARD